MAFDRDIYYDALLTRLKDRVTGVQTWTRRVTHFAKLPASAQPAGLVLATGQSPSMERGLPTVWTLGAEVWYLVRATGQQDVLDSVLNRLVDQTEAALMQDTGEDLGGQSDPFRSSLGGLVMSLSIGGQVEFRQGENGDQAEVVIPIDMVVIGDDPRSG